jgi:molybdopterin-guanine dinucleotide biosynthesis protein A
VNVSAVILAGGQSRRMGRDKAWIHYAGEPLVKLAVDNVRRIGIAEVFISGRPDVDYSALDCPLLLDLQPGIGPLSGIERGLHHCTQPLLLVLAVDMPRMTSACLQKLVARCGRHTGVVPQWQSKFEPLVAIYPKRCHGFAFHRILRGSRAAHDFVADCLQERAVRRWRLSAAAARSFANWNSPDDLEASHTPDFESHKPDRLDTVI